MRPTSGLHTTPASAPTHGPCGIAYLRVLAAPRVSIRTTKWARYQASRKTLQVSLPYAERLESLAVQRGQRYETLCDYACAVRIFKKAQSCSCAMRAQGNLTLGIAPRARRSTRCCPCSSYAAADFARLLMQLSIDCVNCASTSSAMVMTSGNSKLKSREFRLLCSAPNRVTWSIRDSCTSMAGV